MNHRALICKSQATLPSNAILIVSFLNMDQPITMEKLELKIPPLLLMLVFAALMYFASYTPVLKFSSGVPGYAAAFIIALAGIIICGMGVFGFRKAKTTVNPLDPGEASSLVRSGIYKASRNPMYVGFFLLIMGWGLFLGSGVSMLLGLVFIPYMNRFQIGPEERALTKMFGDEYLSYKQEVRRWL